MSFHVPERYRLGKKQMIKGSPYASDSSYGNNGAFAIPRNFKLLGVIASDGGGWEHVSVSTGRDNCPTWEDMCFIKGMFWDPEDCVIQLHPPKSEYVNVHNYCLHLWRPVGQEIPRPPRWMVG